MQSKAWYTPFWFMVNILILTSIKSLFFLKVVIHARLNELPGSVILFFVGWPLLLLGETIIYWVIKKRIIERKWVWAHLLFSLFGFVILMIFRLGVSFLAITHNLDGGRASIRLMNLIESYCFWGSVIIGHAFFIVAIIQSYSYKNIPQPDDNNDILSELPG